MKNDIKLANAYVLKMVYINILLAIIVSFFESNIGQIIFYTLTVVICMRMANKGDIILPFCKPNLKKLLLCIGITLTAFPMAMLLNYIGSILGGVSFFEINKSQPIWLVILSIAICPAIAEEIMYRGVIQGAYMKVSVLYSILFSALAFAFMHFSLSAMMYAFLYGCIFAFVRIFTNNVVYTICMHFIFNLINVGIVYINDNGIRHISHINSHIYIMLVLAILSSVICGVLLIILRRTSEKNIENNTYSIKEFLTKENIIAYVTCILIMAFTQGI